MVKAKRSIKKGLPPGSLIHIGEKKKHTPKITVLDYDKDHFVEKDIEKIPDLLKFKKNRTVSWININGVHDPSLIKEIGEHFAFHPLLLEDIMNTEQRPKFDDYGEYIFIVLKMPLYNSKNYQLKTEQVSLILGRNFVFSFQEKEGDVFDALRERIRKAKTRLRLMDVDYLAYALIDAVIDSYFEILENLGEKIENTEEEVIKNPSQKTMEVLHNLKTEILHLRKSVWPLREIAAGLERSGSALIKKTTILYYRDLYDHAIQVVDSVETYRETISGMMDIYLSTLSNKMNEVMKVLTIMGTIFIPLTTITGVYGMNFEHMPELQWKYGYFMVLIFMAIVAGIMLLYFRKKKWI